MTYTPDALIRALGDRHRHDRYAFAGRMHHSGQWEVCHGWIGAPASRAFFVLPTREDAERAAVRWITGGHEPIADLTGPRWLVSVDGCATEEQATQALRWIVGDRAPIVGRIERYPDRGVPGLYNWRASLIVAGDTAPEMVPHPRNCAIPVEVSRYERIGHRSELTHYH